MIADLCWHKDAPRLLDFALNYRPVLPKQIGCGLMFLLDCKSEGRFSIGFRVDIRAASQQQLDHFYLTILGCSVEWSEITGLF